jgi:hypothetical protein
MLPWGNSKTHVLWVGASYCIKAIDNWWSVELLAFGFLKCLASNGSKAEGNISGRNRGSIRY